MQGVSPPGSESLSHSIVSKRRRVLAVVGECKCKGKLGNALRLVPGDDLE